MGFYSIHEELMSRSCEVADLPRSLFSCRGRAGGALDDAQCRRGEGAWIIFGVFFRARFLLHLFYPLSWRERDGLEGKRKWDGNGEKRAGTDGAGERGAGS